MSKQEDPLDGVDLSGESLPIHLLVKASPAELERERSAARKRHEQENVAIRQQAFEEGKRTRPRKGKKWKENGRDEAIWQYQDQGLTAAQITPKILAVKEWAETDKKKDFNRNACQKVMDRNPKKRKSGRIN